MVIERIRIRAEEIVKADAVNWINEGAAVKGWYTCEITGRKYRGEEARLALQTQAAAVDLMIEELIAQEEATEDISLASEEPLTVVIAGDIQEPTEGNREVEMTEVLMNHVAIEQVKGKPVKLVQISCVDCEAPRAIKPQDVFQVKRCEDCQKRHRNKLRNERAKAKRAAAIHFNR